MGGGAHLVVQQHAAEQVGRLAQGAHEPRAADGEDLLREELLRRETLPSSAPVAERHVDAVPGEIAGFARGVDAQIEPRPGGAEAAQPREQPESAERGKDADAEPRRAAIDRPRCLLDAAESLARRGRQRFAGRREAQRPRQPLEQADAQLLLQVPDLVADRGLRDVQLAPGQRQARVARRRLEGAERSGRAAPWMRFSHASPEKASLAPRARGSDAPARRQRC